MYSALYNLHKENGKAFIWKHFKDEDETRSTICKLIKHAEQGKNVTRKKGRSWKPKFNTLSNHAQFKWMFDNKKESL